MPPSTGKLTTKSARAAALAPDEYRSDDGITVQGGTGYIGEFYDVDPLLQGLQAGGFTRMKHGQRLARLFDDPDPKICLAASKEIRATVRESALMSGQIGQATLSKETPNGESVRIVTRTIVAAPLPPPRDAPGIIVRRPLPAAAGRGQRPEPEAGDAGVHAPDGDG